MAVDRFADEKFRSLFLLAVMIATFAGALGVMRVAQSAVLSDADLLAAAGATTSSVSLNGGESRTLDLAGLRAAASLAESVKRD